MGDMELSESDSIQGKIIEKALEWMYIIALGGVSRYGGFENLLIEERGKLEYP